MSFIYHWAESLTKIEEWASLRYKQGQAKLNNMIMPVENLIQSVQFYTWIVPHLWLEYIHKSLLLVSE